MTREPVDVCVDAGTTVIKAVVFDAAGTELLVARRATRVSRPAPGHSEQDPAEVWTAVAGAVREAVGLVDRPVRLIALTAQGDGAWLVDDAGEPVRPAVLWNDGRAAEVVRRWRAAGTLARAYRVNGSLTSAGLPNAILRVLAVDEPDSLARSRAVLTCGGWLFLRLTGVVGVERSEASAPWLDIRTGEYSEQLVEDYGLTAHRRLLPPILDNRALPLTAVAADQLGVPAGTPVVLAPYDIVSTALGAGATTTGRATCVLGTTLCTELLVDTPEPAGEAAGLTLDFGAPGRWLRAFPTLAGTGVLDWLVDLLGVAGHDEISVLAGQAPPGADGLRVLPYLSPAGERAPFLDPSASGLVGGLLFTHGRAHLARAVLEGLAHVIRDCLDAAATAPVELGLCGGGAASSLWCQLIADVTGVPALRTEDTQVGAKGALLFAATVVGDHADLPSAAAALVRSGTRFTPERSYEAEHAEFLAMRGLAASRWATWRTT